MPKPRILQHFPCLIAALLLAAPASFAESKSDKDDAAIRQQAVDYAKAFAAGDSSALAGMWTEDGTFTDCDGRELKGRAAIQDYFAGGFKKAGAHPLEITIDSIRFPNKDVAIEDGTSRLLDDGYLVGTGRYTAVHVKKDGKWQMAAVTETDGPLKASSAGLKDLEWLVGSWTATGPKGTLHMKADWCGDHKFIICKYLSETSPSAKADEVQIIGWNPMMGRLASWHFDANGGYGYGKWMNDGQTWIESARGVEGDGTVNSGIHSLRKIDDNSFAWRSTSRTLNGKALPDAKEVTVKRDR